MKKIIALILILVCMLGVIACGGKNIGEISGAENEYITIDNIPYVLDTNNDFYPNGQRKVFGKNIKLRNYDESLFCQRRFRGRIYLGSFGLGGCFL